MGRAQLSVTGSSELRRKAEERFKERGPKKAPAEGGETRRLLHDLEVHQIELEMQNEELLRARHEIEAGLVRYTQIFDFAPIAYFVLAPDGVIQELNLAAARLLGIERTRLLGKNLLDFFGTADLGAFAELLECVFANPSEGRTETRELHVEQENPPLDVRIRGSVLQAAPPAALVAIEDITARRLVETQVRDESRRKDEFLAALSHELRNPLSALRYGVHALERAEAGSDLARQASAVLHRQVDHLTGLVDDLLDVTRVAHGKVQLRLKKLELVELVRGTVEDYRPSFDGAGISLAFQADAPCWIEGDRRRLVQVIGNLLANALKFTPRSGSVEVRVVPDQVERETRSVAVSVRDDGMGIARDVLRDLFKPFMQGPQALARAHGGLGLGLAMVKGLVELHRGTVDVVSGGIGAGSTFTIHLPLTAEEGRIAPSDPPPVATHPRRVLVIEDNDDVAESLRNLLQLDRHDVRVASDGRTGIVRAFEFRPDVVFCDIGLPGADGYEVARTLRKDPLFHRTLLVALSGYGLSEDVRRAREAGFDRHVTKPPTLAALETVLAEAPRAAG